MFWGNLSLYSQTPLSVRRSLYVRHRSRHCTCIKFLLINLPKRSVVRSSFHTREADAGPSPPPHSWGEEEPAHQTASPKSSFTAHMCATATSSRGQEALLYTFLNGNIQVCLNSQLRKKTCFSHTQVFLKSYTFVVKNVTGEIIRILPSGNYNRNIQVREAGIGHSIHSLTGVGTSRAH